MIMIPTPIAAEERRSKPVRDEEEPRDTMTSWVRFSKASQLRELLRIIPTRDTDALGQCGRPSLCWSRDSKKRL